PETGGSRATSWPSMSGVSASARSPPTTAEPTRAILANRSPYRVESAWTTSPTVAPSASTEEEPTSSRSAAKSRTFTRGIGTQGYRRGPLVRSVGRDPRRDAHRSVAGGGPARRPDAAARSQGRAPLGGGGRGGARARHRRGAGGCGREPRPRARRAPRAWRTRSQDPDPRRDRTSGRRALPLGRGRGRGAVPGRPGGRDSPAVRPHEAAVGGRGGDQDPARAGRARA